MTTRARSGRTLRPRMPTILLFLHQGILYLFQYFLVGTGCKRSIKSQGPTEAMTQSEAAKFPLIGSAVLFSLFLVLKFIPKDLVNKVLAFYFAAVGVLALVGTYLPFVERILPVSLASRHMTLRLPRVPILAPEGEEHQLSYGALLATVPAIGFAFWNFIHRYWWAQNIMGLCFCLVGIEEISVGSVAIGALLLSGLFFYDIFSVFCTPVMVTVAKGLDVPIKLVFPRMGSIATDSNRFAMLGLGDIVLPGMYLALLTRYDAANKFTSSYFRTTMIGYVCGLVATITVMVTFQAAQPALLYIVPGVLLSSFGHAWWKGELKPLLAFKEEGKKEEEGEKTTMKKKN